jgi:uncharacterized cupredoxin-like copper-binding protein
VHATGRLGLLLGGAGVVTLVAAMAASIAAGKAPVGPVEIDVHFSRFAPEAIRVRAGIPVTFVIRNTDPIDHEWIVGDAETHARHRTGTEPVHASRPTEVSVAALATVSTTVTFDAPGELRFVCHLPGHEAYGMTGTLIVEP